MLLFVALIDRITPSVLQKRWKSIKDAMNKTVKLTVEQRTSYQKQQLIKWNFSVPFLSNYNEGKEKSYALSEAVAKQMSSAAAVTRESAAISNTNCASFTQPEPNAPTNYQVDNPPPSWMPQVKDASRRQLEWQTEKRLNLAKNKKNLLEVSDAERTVDPNFKRPRLTPQQGVFKDLIHQFESIKKELSTRDTNSSMKWAQLVNAHIVQFAPEHRQLAFDTALEVFTAYISAGPSNY